MKNIKLVLLIQHALIIALLSFNSQSKQQPHFHNMELAIKYVEATTTVDLFIGIVERLNDSCDFNLSINESHLMALDYELRENSDFNLVDFTQLVRAKDEYEATVEVYKKQLFKEANGCNKKVFNQWIQNSVLPSIKQSTEFIKNQKNLYAAFVEPYSDEFIRKQLKERIHKYKILPIDEAKKVADALATGGYSYAFISYINNVVKDLPLALQIRKYIVKVEPNLDNLFQLAQTQARLDLTKAIEIYKSAAKSGHKKSQLWLGQHYLCQNNKKAAKPWLDMAIKHSPDVVDDIVGEYEELGKPVVCSPIWID